MRVTGSPSPRQISMSRSGRFVAIRQPDGVDVVDALGTAPRRSLLFQGDVLDFACVGQELWVVTEGKLTRHALASNEEGLPAIDEPVDLMVEHGRLYPVSTGALNTALWLGYERLFLRDADGEIMVDDITDEAAPSAFVGLLGGRRLLIADDGVLRVRDIGRGDVAEAHLPVAGRVVACASLFGGRAMSVLVEGDDGDAFVTMRPSGAVIHHAPLPRTRLWAAADNRGVAVVYEPESDRLIGMDLRYGKIQGRVEGPLRQIEDVVLDADGKYVVMAGARRPEPPSEDGEDGASSASGDSRRPRGEDADDEEDGEQAVYHALYADIFGATIASVRTAPEPDEKGEKRSGEIARRTRVGSARPPAESAPRVDAAAGAEPLPPTDEPAPPPQPIIIPQGPLLGLGRPIPRVHITARTRAEPYGSAAEHLDELLDLVAARAYLAIAEAWNSGRLSFSADDELPFQREVLALIGQGQMFARDVADAASQVVDSTARRLGERATASEQQGMTLPFVELTREFELGSVQAQVLMLVAAPRMRGEISRLYGILANDENRPLCDRYLVETLLGSTSDKRAEVSRALGADGTLVRHGLVRLESAPGEQLFVPLSVDSVLIRRLRGDRYAGAGPTDITTIRHTDSTLERLFVPDELKRDLALALLAPPRDGRPYRVLLRGRRGSGRRTLAAALADRIGKPLAVVDCERLPRTGPAFAAELGDELLRAGLRGAVACISGLEVFDSTDLVGVEHIRAVFRSHPAPVVVRTSPEYQPPIDPGYLSFTLPSLTESERFSFWTDALARHGLRAEGPDRLAARFRIGPGTIEAVIAAGKSRLDDAEEDATSELDLAARQHIQTRMSSVAQRITRLAEWHQVALPDDVHDSIREFIGRVRHRRTVYDTWGFDARMSTSRGLTALFYGPPGTGKSMVAGLIARELGLDLFRVDLARITSKWIGETEKNLAEVFDAGEDGQCIILFDEADSLFAKRTEVKSSVDRYANLEVNYLLQRLDTFEGVAILTTNLEGSIDKAFKRRMSLRLAFPFPDEEMRVRLWAAHIPPEAPTEGDFDFTDLARRFPMSGGYIRNSALRAAFLAAQEDVPMTHGHLERAIHLEYREMGKLAPGGRIE
ncbi:MAG TPA: ATP-binding protein [Haliangium sp.]|nr:ATP-binding protein [Haliangium sp.]